jgi:hypothetical protein
LVERIVANPRLRIVQDACHACIHGHFQPDALALTGAFIDQAGNIEESEVGPQTGLKHLVPEVQVAATASSIPGMRIILPNLHEVQIRLQIQSVRHLPSDKRTQGRGGLCELNIDEKGLGLTPTANLSNVIGSPHPKSQIELLLRRPRQGSA